MSAQPSDAEALQRQLQPHWPGIRVEIVGETGSTNSDLLARCRGAVLSSPTEARAAACLRVAEQQTAGRGRLGRTWHSAPGASLTFSIAVPLARADLSGLSLAVGVVLAEAIDPDCGERPRIGIKWPNDLWLWEGAGRGRKLGGVLIETVSGAAWRQVVVGVGLNIAAAPDAAMAAAESGWSGYAGVRDLDGAIDAHRLLRRVAPALLVALRSFEAVGFAAFHARFAARDLLAGCDVVTTDARAPDGCADGVNASGSLRLRLPDGCLREVFSGDVSVRPARAAHAFAASTRPDPDRSDGRDGSASAAAPIGFALPDAHPPC